MADIFAGLYGIARRSRYRAMAGPVPTHAVVQDNFREVLLCTAGPALTYTNGGGPECPKCLALLRERESDE